MVVQSFKQRHSDGRVKGGVEPIFCLVEIIEPKARMLTDKASKVRFQTSIHHLCLTIGLWMVGNAEL